MGGAGGGGGGSRVTPPLPCTSPPPPQQSYESILLFEREALVRFGSMREYLVRHHPKEIIEHAMWVLLQGARGVVVYELPHALLPVARFARSPDLCCREKCGDEGGEGGGSGFVRR